MYIKQLRKNKQNWVQTTEEQKENGGRKNAEEAENREERNYQRRKQIKQSGGKPKYSRQDSTSQYCLMRM